MFKIELVLVHLSVTSQLNDKITLLHNSFKSLVFDVSLCFKCPTLYTFKAKEANFTQKLSNKY